MRTRTSWRIDGNALGATLIHLAVKHREEGTLEEQSQARFVVEFLVLCRFLLTLFGVGNRIAQSMPTGLHEEFVAFSPDYEDLFEARMERYFKAIEKGSPEELIHCLVDDWACCVGSTSVATWAFEVLIDCSTVFLELIGGVGPDTSRIRCSRRINK